MTPTQSNQINQFNSNRPKWRWKTRKYRSKNLIMII